MAQSISTYLSATAMQQGPIPELYLKLYPLLSKARPWAEELLSFAARAHGVGRDFVRLYHPRGLGNKREKRSKAWTLSFGKGLAKHLSTP